MANKPIDPVSMKKIVRMLTEGKEIIFVSSSTGFSTTTVGKIKRDLGLIDKPKVTEKEMNEKFNRFAKNLTEVFKCQ
jgi:hypothetical protein